MSWDDGRLDLFGFTRNALTAAPAAGRRSVRSPARRPAWLGMLLLCPGVAPPGRTAWKTIVFRDLQDMLAHLRVND
jgi:hypothetical protein